MNDSHTQQDTEPERTDTSSTGGIDPEREEAIRRRAYEISQSEHGGTAEENWERAEREVRGS
jgi:hypothetical protein